ncbi:MAG: transcriptional regulator [Gammaproteobacteria bacterium RIFCSPLOWO2_02_FULL_42_14]|nr:MAG: transcriptional regulator [Gammaproteobacteria bacterium RIFCSPHIGHO2_02_FULL_42_43]OGT29359.1 MAG: transcriptional regulator [Gammaproteobacteria bacterium RIFCSPHIGHO2_01_FULL_42_8]OGT50906.1 MAG: transcriptional regulator [Gammaproteobacteria bacterium RIFCSPHIGHO2_12_FULL_41_25]OGT62843.1 MAG: transcriptional regulator [Gammaproteobacteria bacterium RIFCSPLOWO2_02_FULL_42_14]OGT86801.1 MAG: transcriptional regulator [Gammaproteobacteria bacterium RIFCSPLOWO2_12_FULL_42_18]
MDKTRLRLLSAAHEMAKDLHAVGAMDIVTMREFDAHCLLHIGKFSATKIKQLRKDAGVSQPVFAKIINVNVATIKQWERGERTPSGAALKLLFIIKNKGIEVAL